MISSCFRSTCSLLAKRHLGNQPILSIWWSGRPSALEMRRASVDLPPPAIPRITTRVMPDSKGITNCLFILKGPPRGNVEHERAVVVVKQQVLVPTPLAFARHD